jgi:uracil-DNA glycosylase
MPEARGSNALTTIRQRLKETYPDARYELDWETPLELLVATILAAQCTDERVNAVTKSLFPKYPDARSYAWADTAELEEDVRPTGFYRNKAKAIQGACRVLVDRFGGEVPRRMDDMLTLPGVARKTANVVLTNAFGLPSGVIVDTHVARVSRRLGLTDEEDPERIEADLMRLLPQDEWVAFGPAMVLHGRYTCTAKAPHCGRCVLEDACEKRGVTESDTSAAAPRPAPRRGPEPTPTSPARGGDRPAGDGGLPEGWRSVLAGEFEKPYFRQLQQFVAEERRSHQVFPPEADVFNALRLTPYERTRVLLLGQDPYHDDRQAHGLCFSVRQGVKPPPSLVNIFKELQTDLGCRVPNHGCLTAWAERGVLLLNAVLTVRAHEPNSHKDKGWETFTDAVIRALDARPEPVVFVLWGNYAQKKGRLIDSRRHPVIAGAHPSPLSAKKFFGSRPFSAVNDALKRLGEPPIDWQLPDL